MPKSFLDAFAHNRVDQQPVNEFRIGEHDGMIVLKFPRPVEWVKLTKEQARDMARLLLQHAGSIRLT